MIMVSPKSFINDPVGAGPEAPVGPGIKDI